MAAMAYSADISSTVAANIGFHDNQEACILQQMSRNLLGFYICAVLAKQLQ